MSEKNDPNPETQPVRPTGDSTPGPAADAAPAVPPGPPADAAPVVPPGPPAEAAPAVPPGPPGPPAEAASSDPALPPAAAPGQPVKRSLRDRFAGTGDRLHTTRGLAAATLAALIVGGFGGAAIHAAVDDGPDHGRFSRGDHPGEMGRDFGGRMGEGERPGPPGDFFQQAPGGLPGQLPPTTTPSPSESPSDSSDS